jgi:hypothetical protein
MKLLLSFPFYIVPQLSDIVMLYIILLLCKKRLIHSSTFLLKLKLLNYMKLILLNFSRNRLFSFLYKIDACSMRKGNYLKNESWRINVSKMHHQQKLS